MWQFPLRITVLTIPTYPLILKTADHLITFNYHTLELDERAEYTCGRDPRSREVCCEDDPETPSSAEESGEDAQRDKRDGSIQGSSSNAAGTLLREAKSTDGTQASTASTKSSAGKKKSSKTKTDDDSNVARSAYGAIPSYGGE